MRHTSLLASNAREYFQMLAIIFKCSRSFSNSRDHFKNAFKFKNFALVTQLGRQRAREGEASGRERVARTAKNRAKTRPCTTHSCYLTNVRCLQSLVELAVDQQLTFHTTCERMEKSLERREQPELPVAAPSATPARKRGCSCKKSSCLKLYCNCFGANGRCGDRCHCMGCKNREVCACVTSEGFEAACVALPTLLLS